MIRLLMSGMFGVAAVVLGVLAAACGDDDDGGPRTIGDLTFNDHGTTDARGKGELELEADSFYFGPTFIRGNAGEKLRLVIENESDALHNISIESLGIDADIPAEGRITVEVTFPSSGVALFVCKYHAQGGMRGELLTGEASPAAVQAAGGPNGGGTESGGNNGAGYGY